MSREPDASRGEVVVYESPDGAIRVDVRLERETSWLTQKQMAVLFGTSTDIVGLHLKNIFNEGELSEAATAEDSSVVQTEGRRQVRRVLTHHRPLSLSIGRPTTFRLAEP